MIKDIGPTLPKVDPELVAHVLGAEPSRVPWPKLWMMIAATIANKRSLDNRLKVGAIVVPEDNTGIIALGYNGGPKGLYNVPQSLEPGKSQFVHAEANALIKCPYHYPVKKHMYVTHSPCQECARMIINAGIARVVYGELYRDTSSIELLRSAGIETYSVDEAILIAESR